MLPRPHSLRTLSMLPAGLLVLGLLAQCMPEAFKPQLPSLVAGLAACLSHAVREVQLAALRASSLFIQVRARGCARGRVLVAGAPSTSSCTSGTCRVDVRRRVWGLSLEQRARVCVCVRVCMECPTCVLCSFRALLWMVGRAGMRPAARSPPVGAPVCRRRTHCCACSSQGAGGSPVVVLGGAAVHPPPTRRHLGEDQDGDSGG